MRGGSEDEDETEDEDKEEEAHLWEEREPSKCPQTRTCGQWRRTQDTEPATGKDTATLGRTH